MHRLERKQFANAKRLLEAMLEITGPIPRSDLEAAFLPWEE
jgi:hypothetical protein